MWAVNNSQTPNIGNYLRSGSNFPSFMGPVTGIWVYELDQDWNGTSDFVKDYEPSDCTGRPPHCEERNITGLLSDLEPDVELYSEDEYCYSNGSFNVGQSFMIGNFEVQYFRMCVLGYITLGPESAEELHSPSDFSRLENSTIVAGGLVMPFSFLWIECDDKVLYPLMKRITGI